MKQPFEHLHANAHIHHNDLRFYVHYELSCLLAELEHRNAGHPPGPMDPWAIEKELRLILANLSDWHWKDANAFAEKQA